MLTTTGRGFRSLTLTVWAGFATSTAIHAQSTTGLFTVPPLTLTETAMVASAAKYLETLVELRQAVQTALDSKRYKTALEYTTFGLAASPKDLQLLAAYATALIRLQRFPEAIAAVKDVLAVDPANPDAVNNLAELLLITGQIDEYRTFMSQHKLQIDAVRGGMLSKYFLVLEAYHTSDTEQFRAVVTQVLKSLPAQAGTFLSDWSFAELFSVVSQPPDSPKKSLLRVFIAALTEEVRRGDALNALQRY